jgi:Tfp pilus assembly protein PilX
MLTTSHRRRVSRSRAMGPRRRRGVALVFVLVFVVAMAALAMSSIFMASNSNLLAKSYDRERDLRFAAEAALAIGKARVNSDPSLLVMTGTNIYKQIMSNATIMGADSAALPGIQVNVYVGLTGSSSGQNGRFASIVAQAIDSRSSLNGLGFIRRLELTQESFAKFAYWSNSETNNGNTIFFNNGDELWGPVWSNDVISIGSGGATFHDQVGTAKTISGKSNGTFVKAPLEGQPVINLPSTTTLTALAGYATVGNTNLPSGTTASANENSLRDRIEFVAFDIDGIEDSTSDDEGFFRYFRGNADATLRGNWPTGGPPPPIANVTQCGDWHWAPGTVTPATMTPPTNTDTTRLKFYPASVHNTTWFRNQIDSGYFKHGGVTQAQADAYADAEKISSVGQILDNPNARCYLAGDPHLVATERVPNDLLNYPDPKFPLVPTAYTTASVNKGGEDTTFTPKGRNGAWLAVAQTSFNNSIKGRRPWDGLYLHPLTRKYNTNMKGVIYTPGNVGISGTVNGLVTLYAKGTVVILDDVRYANDPVKSVCHDILGIISDFDVVVADNAINTPPQTYSSGTTKYFSLDDTKDLNLHAVVMALGTSFRVQNYDQGPTDVNDCDGVNNGRGCIFLSGGLIQKSRGAVGTSSGTGYSKRYTYDHCAVVNPPPYFPTTGRFQDNRYLELDPAGFNPQTYFQSLTPNP